MARYISPNRNRMHMVGEKIFKFEEGMLYLEDTEDIRLLDSEIKKMKQRGDNPYMEKIPEVEAVPDKSEVTEDFVTKLINTKEKKLEK